MTAGFMVPVYRFSDGWTWCRVGRAAFSGENPPRDDRLRRSLAMLSSQDDIKLFLFSHASAASPKLPLFFLIDSNSRIMEAFDCPSDQVLYCSTLQIPPYYESRPMFRYLALLEGLGVPFEDLQGPLPYGLEDFQVPYWVDDATWKTLETHFSDDLVKFLEREDQSTVEQLHSHLGPESVHPYTSEFSFLRLGAHFEMLLSVHSTDIPLAHDSDRGHASRAEFRLSRVSDMSVESKSWSLFSALQKLNVDPQTLQGEPMLLPLSEFEAWWAAKVDPVESVFDLSMFKLLGVRSPYLLPDDEFIAWVEALGGLPEVP